MISVQIKNPDAYRVSSPAEIEEVLAPLGLFMNAARFHTYSELRVVVGTPEAGFSRIYPNFDELEAGLIPDFRAAREADGSAYFDRICIEMTKRLRQGSPPSLLQYTGGEIVLDRCEDEDVIYESCCLQLKPYLYYKW